jgi:hypothetical protein
MNFTNKVKLTVLDLQIHAVDAYYLLQRCI